MAFRFLHRSPSKRGKSSWLENALVLAVAGSIIALIGQLAVTVIPIMYGPSDISDYSISVNPIYIETNLSNLKISGYVLSEVAEIEIDDSHKFLRPYKYDIYLQALNLPAGWNALFTPPGVKFSDKDFFIKLRDLLLDNKTAKISKMEIWVDPAKEMSYHPIIIQGMGSDGKTHNTTLYISIMDKVKLKPEEKRSRLTKDHDRR